MHHQMGAFSIHFVTFNSTLLHSVLSKINHQVPHWVDNSDMKTSNVYQFMENKDREKPLNNK